jgi:hypothetical protein
MRKIRLIKYENSEYHFCLNDLLYNLFCLEILDEDEIWKIKKGVFNKIYNHYKKGSVGSSGLGSILMLNFQLIFVCRFTTWELEEIMPKKVLKNEYYIKFYKQFDWCESYDLRDDWNDTVFDFKEFSNPYALDATF